MSRIMVTADWQLCHKPDNYYRWSVFHTIESIQRAEKYDELWVLGDVIDGKDRLPNHFICELMRDFHSLAQLFGKVRILPGNHDFKTGGVSDNSILCILNWIENIEVMTRMETIQYGEKRFLWVPNELWLSQPAQVDCVLAHHMVLGALGDDCKTEIGDEKGVELKYLEKVPLVLSGDVHASQFFQLPNMDTTWAYVGAPHHIRYGEEWSPTYVELEPETCVWRHRHLSEKVRFLTVDCRVNDEIKTDKLPDDKLRVRVHMGPPAEWSDLVAYMREWEEHGADEVIVLVESAGGEERQIMEGADSYEAERLYAAYCEWKDVPKDLEEKGRDFL